MIEAAAAPLAARQAEEVLALEAVIAARGERGSGRRRLEYAHKREQRRHRTEELRYGLATLTARYGEALFAGTSRADGVALVDALSAIDRAARALARNPNETLLLASLFLRLPPLR
jgi:DNA polymerase-3 subunit delta'